MQPTSLAECWPAGHAEHGVDALRSVSAKPDAQALQAVRPAAAYCPTEQATQRVAGLASLSTLPAPHAPHLQPPPEATA